MEMTTYKCPTCGFVFLVPAYWSDYDAAPTLELDHVNLENQLNCECKILELVK